MPQLTFPITPQGALLDILVSVSGPRMDFLTAGKQPIPPYQSVKGLIDTGASCTCVDPQILSRLNISPTGAIQVHTPSTGATPHMTNQFDVSIILVHPHSTFPLHSVPVIEADLAVQGIQALIGRDVLSQCLLIYNGELNTYTLSF